MYELYLVRITTDTCNTLHSEIERFEGILARLTVRQTCFFQKGYDEAAQAAVDMHANIVL